MPIDTNFQYTKTWRSEDDFHTYEGNEEKVRDDMQCLFDEVRDALNRLAEAVIAANIPFTAIEGVPADNVAGAIAALKTAIDGVSVGTMQDNSIETAKLKDGAVTAPKLAEDAVTGDKLADGAVSPDKIAAGAVDASKLALTDGGFVVPPLTLTAGVHYFDSVEALEETLASAPIGTIAFVEV